MNKKNRTLLSLVSTGLLLVLVITPLMPLSSADYPHSVKGTLYIDDAIASAGVDITIRFGDESESAETFPWDGAFNYNIGFFGYEGETGYFYVNYDGVDWIPEDNTSVTIVNGVITYYIDLHVNTSTGPPPSNPPYEPSDPDPEDGAVDTGKKTTSSRSVHR